jgi:hypothetical protein
MVWVDRGDPDRRLVAALPEKVASQVVARGGRIADEDRDDVGVVAHVRYLGDHCPGKPEQTHQGQRQYYC